MKSNSAQPRKKRKFRFTASLHLSNKFRNVHLSKELRLKLKKRAVRARKGDTVKIMKGKFKGLSGKVTALGRGTLNIEGALLKKLGGKEVPVDIQANNVMITQMVERK